MKNLLLASTSTIYGSEYLEYILPELEIFFIDVKEVLFIPYARPSGISYDEYTQKAQKAFNQINISVKGIHHYKKPSDAIKKAEAVFVGGGNTFELVNQLYKNNILLDLETAVYKGLKYFGTSAGVNICGPTMKTTNDMPIVYPPSFNTLGLVPFNINPHYLDPNPNSKHKGETRETRIKEFHAYNDTPVIGLREGSWIEVFDNEMILKGKRTARLFMKNKKPIEIKSQSVINNYLM
jgi:dipeptidase E